MNDLTIEDGKFVELIYKVVDKKTGDILSAVEFPLGYIHGVSEILSPEVTAELAGHVQGDVVELEIDIDQIYGPRDESLVFTDALENVPKEYHKVGTTITMQGEHSKDSKDFIVMRMDENTITIDGNHPLSGCDGVFVLEVVTVREATDEEAAAGSPIYEAPDIKNMQSIH